MQLSRWHGSRNDEIHSNWKHRWKQSLGDTSLSQGILRTGCKEGCLGVPQAEVGVLFYVLPSLYRQMPSGFEVRLSYPTTLASILCL